VVAEIPIVLASILDRGPRGALDEVAFFQLLFVSQSLAFLKKYCSAIQADDFDGGLDICRSIYETVLRIRYLRYQPEDVKIFIALLGLESGSYEYARRGAKTDWNTVMEKKTGLKINVRISNYKMASASGKKIDSDVYSVLFRYMSTFVHPNVDSWDRYFYRETGFRIHFEDNPFEGLFVCVFVLILLFSEIAQLTVLRQLQRRDARFICKRLASSMQLMEGGGAQIFAGRFSCVKEKMSDAVREAAAA
jgi:hypothetical protein